VLVIVLKFLSIFYLSAKATHPAPATYQAAGLASSRTPLSLSWANAFFQTIFGTKSFESAFGSFWNKNTLALQACQKPLFTCKLKLYY